MFGCGDGEEVNKGYLKTSFLLPTGSIMV